MVTVPDREQVTRTWTKLISGAVTRAAAHAWTVRWAEDEPELVTDPMTGSALLHLHGFDLAHAGDGLVEHGVSAEWPHSEEDIAAAFTRWRAATADYHRDPRARERALEQRRGDQPES